jgi:hypothetical protein
MNSERAITIINSLKGRIDELLLKPRGIVDFDKWHRDSQIAIENIFGVGSRHIHDFNKIQYASWAAALNGDDSDNERVYRHSLKKVTALFDSYIDEINEYWESKPEVNVKDQDPIDKVLNIIDKFHSVARQLKHRHADRETLHITDEYDVQDLFHALLKLHFDDIRPEEYVPSYAGADSRVDFLLKNENIIIELKMTRRGLRAKDIGEQLIIDSLRYQLHPNCESLICFVYDPDGFVQNPRGLENDLSQTLNDIPISVFIRPSI